MKKISQKRKRKNNGIIIAIVGALLLLVLPVLIISIQKQSTQSVAKASSGSLTPGFFARGMYETNDGAHNSTFKSLGFNIVNVSPDVNALNNLTAQGLRGVVWLAGSGTGYDETTCSFTSSDATISAQLNAIKGNPAIVAYEIADEPNNHLYACPNNPQQIQARTNLIHSIDPTVPTYIVVSHDAYVKDINGNKVLEQYPYHYYVGTADLLGLDVYVCRQPAGTPCDYSLIDSAIQAADSQGIPHYWGIPQDFEDTNYRRPTTTEVDEQFNHWANSRMEGYFVFSWDWQGNSLDNYPDHQTQLQTENTRTFPNPMTPTPVGSITYVQGQAAGSSGQVASESVTMANPVKSGDLLVGWFAQYNAPGQISVSDNVNGAWTRVKNTTYSSGTGDIALYYKLNSAAAPSGLTVTATAGGVTYLTHVIAHYTNVPAGTVLDQSAVAKGNSTSASAGPTLSIPAGELVFGAEVTGGNPTAASVGSSQGVNFVKRAANSTGSATAEDIISGAAGAQTSSFSLTAATDWYSTVATFALPVATPTSVVAPTNTPIPPTATPVPTLIPTATSTPVDTTAPTVSITSPQNGATVSRNSVVTIAASASDNVRVAKVVFLVSGSTLCTDTTYPYSCTWTVPSARGKTYTLTAQAFDGTGNTSSKSITVSAK